MKSTDIENKKSLMLTEENKFGRASTPEEFRPPTATPLPNPNQSPITEKNDIGISRKEALKENFLKKGFKVKEPKGATMPSAG